MKYTIICKLKNGKTLRYLTSTFFDVMNQTEIYLSSDYTASVVIVNNLTGATTKYIF